jgi:hydroxymethylglutaryl-CoA synthase
MPDVNWLDGGIVRWGAYVPRYRLSTELISKEWGGSGTTHKSVANIDEDATTLGIEAARRAVVGYDREIDCVFFGSESKPYAAKASAITVAESIGAGPFVSTIDLESACRGAVEGRFRACDGVGSGSVKQALVVASDVAHSAIGDPLKKTASAAADAFVVGSADEAEFSVSKPVSYATDTIDFHRRDGASYPLTVGRFANETAKFQHMNYQVYESKL